MLSPIPTLASKDLRKFQFWASDENRPSNSAQALEGATNSQTPNASNFLNQEQPDKNPRMA